MKRLWLVAAVCAGISVVGMAGNTVPLQTMGANEAVRNEVDFANREDFDDAMRGFIATIEDTAICDENGRVVFSLAAWDFLKAEAPATVNPSLWRQSQLNRIHGLFEVVPGKIYQVRGFDIANMTFVRSDNGWVIIDALTSEPSARAAYRLVKEHLGNLPVKALVITHPHTDHFGGVDAVFEEAPNRDFPVIAPKGFLESAQSENVMAGVAMSRRSIYMFGQHLPYGADAFVGCGLGQTLSHGVSGIVKPDDLISATGETRTIDGLQMEFVFVPDGEAPVEIMIYFPQLKAFCTAEEITHNMHNLVTLRGAKVRDGLNWSKHIDEAICRYGDKVEVSFATHHWPTWGNERIVRYWEAQRDLYRYVHDQTLHLANRGFTPNEIAEQLRLPASLDTLFHCRGYYGTVSHNSKAQYQMYFGWFDGNPANLNPLPPVELGKKYVEALGGSAQVLALGRKAYDSGDYRWGATLLNHLVFAEPENMDARRLLADTYRQMGYQAESAVWRNFFLTGAQELLKPSPKSKGLDTKLVDRMQTPVMLDFCAIQVSGEKAAGKEAVVNVHFTDTGERVSLTLKNGVLTPRIGRHEPNAIQTLSIGRGDFVDMMFRGVNLDTLVVQGKATTDGDAGAIRTIISTFEPSDPNFNIVVP